MKEHAQNKDLNIKVRCYDVDSKEEPNEYSKMKEIIYIKLQKYECFIPCVNWWTMRYNYEALYLTYDKSHIKSINCFG